jgi:hypothetical protein
MKDFSNWKSRSHCLGYIIPKEKGRGGHLAEIKQLWVAERYNVDTRLHSKYLDKGLSCESEGIGMLKQLFYPDEYVTKNTKEFEGEFTKGTPDVIMDIDDSVTDIKNAWNAFTFENAAPTHNNIWQLNNYAFMTGKSKCRLFYCLNSMPDFMLSEMEQRELRQGRYLSEYDPKYLEACEKMRQENSYNHIPIEERVKFWEWEPTQNEFHIIIKSVQKARIEMDNLENIKASQIEVNKSVLLRVKEYT